MRRTPTVLPYEPPAPTPRRVDPLTRWFYLDAFLFLGGLLLLTMFYYEMPEDHSAPLAADAVIFTLLCSSAVLFMVLVGCMVVREWRGWRDGIG